MSGLQVFSAMSFVNVIGAGWNDDSSLDERGHKALLVL